MSLPHLLSSPTTRPLPKSSHEMFLKCTSTCYSSLSDSLHFPTSLQNYSNKPNPDPILLQK